MRITATATSYSLACFTLSCFTLLPVTTDAFTPAVMSPLFVNNLPPQPADISSSNNNEQPYVPASLYTADSNDQRYSASDWYHNMMTLPRSSILSEIKGPVLSLTIWSGLVSVVHKILLNKNMLQAAQSMTMSSKPHSFLVSSIGLLLVFRTNSAYQRFAEGRQIWEKILSVSRNMSRMASLYEKDLGEERRKRVFRLLSAFPYLLRHHIQPQCLDCNDTIIKEDSPYSMMLLKDAPSSHSLLRNTNTRQRYSNKITSDGECWVDRRSLPWCLLPDIALRKCANAENRPLWICDRLSQELQNVGYGPNFTSRERLQFMGHVDKLSHCIGECERIHQTAVPLNYARHSLRSLTLWLFTLPFCLLSELGLLTGPVVGAMAWLLLGVYQIGYTIEDPFQGSLRLNLLCDAVYRDVMYIGREAENARDSAYVMDDMAEWQAMDAKSAKSMPESSPLIGVAP